MKLEFQEYNARKIVNIHRHVDGPWFWTKFSAHPYVGCRSGCEFCYLRGGSYLGRRDPETFDRLIQVKANAVQLLEKELKALEPDVINCGDWQQPAEDRYQVSRAMLEVVLGFDFPLFIIERSPLVTRDVDLLGAINQRSWACVAFSISNLDPVLKQAFEPRSPGVKRRFQAMETLAKAGVLVGTAMMPILPVAGDDDRHLGAVVKATKDHGGSFVLAGGLTMAGVQAERTFAAARRMSPKIEHQYRQIYNRQVAEGGQYASPPKDYTAKLGRKVRQLCDRYGLRDRIPRFILPGPLSANKWIAEKLFLKMYELELEEKENYRIWAYRKAAWAVDEWPENIEIIYRNEGEGGLLKIPGIGNRLSGEIAHWLQE